MDELFTVSVERDDKGMIVATYKGRLTFNAHLDAAEIWSLIRSEAVIR